MAFDYRIDAAYGKTKVLENISGCLQPGEVVSLVGLSGSGKTTLSLALLQLLHFRGGTVTGSIRLRDRELMGLSQGDLRLVRGKSIGYVPQSPASALNPRMRVQELLKETWQAHSDQACKADFFANLLESVRLPSHADFLRKFAGSLSVGQGQRLLIALAILHRPAVLLADEPTSALDVIAQKSVLALLSDLATRFNMATLFISHDLQAVSSFSDRVEILHQGCIVESGAPADIFLRPAHPFTRELVQAIPRPLLAERESERVRGDF